MAIENVPKILKSLDEFKDLIDTEQLVVVDFHATWCGPCKLISPKFENLVEKYPTVIFAKVDVDEVPAVAADQVVRAMPTFIFYKGGNKIADVVGANLQGIVELLETHK